jgi:hypothetical protein
MEPRQVSSARAHTTYYTPSPHNRLPPTPTPPTSKSRLVRGVLLAQLASPNGPSLADAAELLSPYVDGIDLNCGCPQKWAHASGIGCALLRKPELVRDMVRAVKDRLGWDYSVSIKIRVDDDPKWVDRELLMTGSPICSSAQHSRPTSPTSPSTAAHGINHRRTRSTSRPSNSPSNAPRERSRAWPTETSGSMPMGIGYEGKRGYAE